MFGTKSKPKQPPPRPAESETPRPVRPTPAIAEPPDLLSDPEYAKAAESSRRCDERLADLRRQRDELAAKLAGRVGESHRSHLDIAAKVALASLDGDQAEPIDLGAFDELKRLDVQIETWQRAVELQGDQLREAERFAARRLGSQYGLTLAPLREAAVAKLYAAHDALAELVAAWQRGEDARLSVPVLGIEPTAPTRLFQLVADLREYGGYAAGGGVPVPARQGGA